MYCRKCGNKLGDSDHYCQYCGTPSGIDEQHPGPAEAAEPKEEVVFNPPYENKSHFTEEEPAPEVDDAQPVQEEDLREFISENEIDAQKQEEEAAGEPPVKSAEFKWTVHEFPSSKKTESVEFNWNMEDFGKQEPKDASAIAFEEELFREIRDESNRIREQNIDRFFTFSRKNEEFQELLDREYEKVKMRSEPIPSIRKFKLPSAVLQPEGQDEIETKAAEIHAAEEAEVPEEAPQPEAEMEIVAPEQPETETEKPEQAEEAVEMESQEEVQETETVSAESAAAPKAEHLSEMAKARAQFFGAELIQDNESIKKKLTPEDQAEETISEPSAEASDLTERITEEADDDIEAAAKDIELTEKAREESGQTEETDILPVPIFFPETVADDGEVEKPKRTAGQIALAVIAIILTIEIIILGIRYFAPESDAARAINEAQAGIFHTVSGWFSGINDGASGNDEDKNANDDGENSPGQQEQPDEQKPDDGGTNTPAPDPNPMADKNALVSSQLGNNMNIAQVKANEALAYKPGKDYGRADINNAKPIANNIWQTPENGDPVYYDQSIVGTIISFDSQWIDYVNGGNKSVLDLLKKDSEAYRKTLSFSKVGKIKETFQLLEIGEIRQGAAGFYVWAHEELQITEKGKTTNQKYNWIYYLEPIDGKMQIVNYFKFQ